MRVLAVGAHPDDLEILCAGTLARYRRDGHQIIMAHACNGNCGHFIIPPDELAAIRAKEAEAAAALLDAEVLTLEGVGDGELVADDPAQRRAMVELIRRARPDVIITHTPDDYMPDHVATSQLVFFASFFASTPNYKTGTAPHHEAVPPIFYMDTLAGANFLPEEYVDITDTLEIKLKMLECHQSQLVWLREHDGIDMKEFVEVTARFRGLQCGVRYAEGFRRLRTWPRATTARLLP
ncbi:MAG TPA: PIG-L family deacetylase [Firmicutes bacterium]|nr:PIG-L family deacetylase [Bacillota bacterium]